SAASERTSAGPSSRDCVVVTRAACRSAREAETPGARGPRPVPAAVVPHAGRDGDLLLAGGLVRQRRVVGAAVGAPGTGVELQAPVVAVAGVDRPVARGLALREPVPHAAVGDERGAEAVVRAQPHDAGLGRGDAARPHLLAADLLAVLHVDPHDRGLLAGRALVDDHALAPWQVRVLDDLLGGRDRPDLDHLALTVAHDVH